MGKKRIFLGFLSVFVFLCSVCVVHADDLVCSSGTYYDVDSCVGCPDSYPESDDAATSINQCYVSYDETCTPGETCPEHTTKCSWNIYETVSGKEYYGTPADKTCSISSFTCEKNYYKTSDFTCVLCTEIPGYEGIYSRSAGTGSEATCYTLCIPMCTHDSCPDRGTCAYEDKQAGTGGVFYPNSNTIDNCKPILKVSCAMSVECNEEGYNTFYPGTGKNDPMACLPNTLTINFDPNGADGDTVVQTCTYDEECLTADALERENWAFDGWNTKADGSGQRYASVTSIKNIITGWDPYKFSSLSVCSSDNQTDCINLDDYPTAATEITLYAQWVRLSAVCRQGQYYDGSDYVTCPKGSFCPGVGEAAAGEAGCATTCPDGGTSDAGAETKSQCYFVCATPSEIRNGTLSVVNNKEYNDGLSDSYPGCTYTATCNEGYIPKNNNTAAPKCVWENPDACPVGFYCPDGADEPIECPRIRDDESSPRGTTVIGARAATDCYYIFEPWESFQNGNAAAKCKYTDDVARYSACNLDKAFSCLPGYYQLTEQTVGCTGVQQGYYSDGTTTSCLSDNYTISECVSSLKQKECPEKTTNPTVASAEYATSITQCNKACEKTDAHGTVSAVAERVYAAENGVYQACQFSVDCNTGYVPTQNGTENAYCAPRKYTVVLNKNGGTGDIADSVQCTFDSGECGLPSVDGLQRAGYSVVPKWCTASDGSGICYTAGASVTTNISVTGADVTLYAIWTSNVYKVTLNDNVADVKVAPTTVYLKYATGWFADAGATTPITALDNVPEKTGYLFSGFFNADAAIRVVNENGEFLKSDTALKFSPADSVIYAKWAAGVTTCASGTYYVGTGAECANCTANSYCTGGSFATDGGIAGIDACPDKGVSAPNAKTVAECYKVGLEYTAPHGSGTQTCYYDVSKLSYSAQCRDWRINLCNAGYWFNSVENVKDCVSVGDGFYSDGTSVSRMSCPVEDGVSGQTGIENATSMTQCWMTDRVYNLDNGGALYGSGTQTCYYNKAAEKYNTSCIRDSVKITYCNAGYWFDVEENKFDCVPVGEDFYSEIAEIVRHACPAPKSPESGAPNTRGNTTTDSATGCFLTRELTTAVHGRGRWGCFYNDDASVKDYTNCSNPEMYECDGGYYYKSSVLANDCIVVGYNNYSPAKDINLYACPGNGYTKTETSSSSSQCLKDNQVCTVSNGSGLQTCSFNGTDMYDVCDCSDGCTACSVTSCDAGYSQVGNACIKCPANNICTGGTQNTCSVLTDGVYKFADSGSTDIKSCYRNCIMAENAVAMTGRDYYGGQNTCAISACKAGYNLHNGKCEACPVGSYCGVGTEKQCSSLGDGTWTLSALGSTVATDCYQECKEHAVENGVAIPVSERAYYDTVCEYTGKSDNGNDCEIIDNVCVETSCRNIYEMINGRCVPCNRANALSYLPDGNCIIASCVIGYHVSNGECVENTRECLAPNATVATQTWDFAINSFGTCIISECQDGYHVASNACVSDIQSCDIENGIGEQEWNHSTHSWDNCIATSCNAGYTTDPAQTNERWKPCGVCNNKFGVLGNQAASTYVRECEIASCMYQGEMYNLENNECVPICDINGYEDETGIMKWNSESKKCVRKCKSGYVMWP